VDLARDLVDRVRGLQLALEHRMLVRTGTRLVELARDALALVRRNFAVRVRSRDHRPDQQHRMGIIKRCGLWLRLPIPAQTKQIAETLEQQLNARFAAQLPSAVKKRRWRLAINLNLRPYDGQAHQRAEQGKSVLPLVCPVIPAEPVPDPDPGAGIHRSQGPNFLSIALHGNWIPVSQPE
jgi:hypothetical protein